MDQIIRVINSNQSQFNPAWWKQANISSLSGAVIMGKTSEAELLMGLYEGGKNGSYSLIMSLMIWMDEWWRDLFVVVRLLDDLAMIPFVDSWWCMRGRRLSYVTSWRFRVWFRCKRRERWSRHDEKEALRGLWKESLALVSCLRCFWSVWEYACGCGKILKFSDGSKAWESCKDKGRFQIEITHRFSC